MKRILLLFSLLALYRNDVEDCSGFESYLSQGCSALSNGPDICVYSQGNCIQSHIYTECEEYAPDSDSNFDDDTCKKINPNNGGTDGWKYKCIISKNINNQKICLKEEKTCEDHEENDDCFDLKAGEGQRCVLINNKKCEAHYSSCSELKDKTKCEANIPSSNIQKCEWIPDDEVCQETDRFCKDYIIYIEKDKSSEQCENLKLKLTNSLTLCALENSRCSEYYIDCSAGINNQTLCESIKPIESGSSYYSYCYDKCIYTKTGENTGTCTKVKRKCNDFIYGRDEPAICRYFEPSNSNHECVYDHGTKECHDLFKSCDSYNLDNIDKNSRDASTCKSIIPNDKSYSDLYECAFDTDDKNCYTKRKDCSSFTTEYSCNSQSFDDEPSKVSKRCLFINDECKEIDKTCQIYNNNVAKEQRSKSNCEQIVPIYTDAQHNGYSYKCVFDEDTKECFDKKIECEDYKGDDEIKCQMLSNNLDDSSKFKCSIVKGKCIKQYKYCNSYNLDFLNKIKNKTLCETINLSANNKKCILKNDQTCTEIKKTCSEYTGTSEYDCIKYFEASKTDHVCSLVNNKCIEQPKAINYCSDYRGTNKQECESIKPSNEYIDSIGYPSKCVYSEEEGCIKVILKCEDAKTYDECQIISPTNTNKQCAYVNNICQEQYKTCQLYQDTEDLIEKIPCESIIDKTTTYTNNLYQCKFKPPATTDGKGTCIATKRACADFKPDLVRDVCTVLSLPFEDKSKYCIFENDSCQLKTKTCLEMNNLNVLSINYCEVAATSSSSKKCKRKSDSSGCEEISQDGDNSDDNNQSGNNNDSKGIKCLGLIIVISLCLLF